MNYLVSKLPDAIKDEIKLTIAEENEPVIPAFPIKPDYNVFLSVVSGKSVPYAKVAVIEIKPVDYLADCINKLVILFPGLPESILKKYVVATYRGANQLPPGTIVMPYIDADSARLRVRGGDMIINLWSVAPTE